MTQRVITTILLFLALLTWTVRAQGSAELEQYIGTADFLIEKAFGTPDAIRYLDEKETVIWTYVFTQGERQEGLRRMEFAFWNGHLAALDLVECGAEADAVYEAGYRLSQRPGELARASGRLRIYAHHTTRR